METSAWIVRLRTQEEMDVGESDWFEETEVGLYRDLRDAYVESLVPFDDHLTGCCVGLHR